MCGDGHADPRLLSMDSWALEIVSINNWHAIFELRGCDSNSERRVFSENEREIFNKCPAVDTGRS